MSILKSCPFCGSIRVFFYDRSIDTDHDTQGEIICLDCQCRTGVGEKTEVNQAWNTRTLDKAIEKACDEGEIEKFACKLIAKHCDECVGTDSKCPVSTAISNHIRSVFEGGGE